MGTTRSFALLLLAAVLITLPVEPSAVYAKAQELSDDEMDGITVGADFCQFAVTNGVCTPSLFQILNPQLALPGQQSVIPLGGSGFLLSMQQLINPQTEPLTQVVVMPLPASGTVRLSLQASATSPDGTRSQLAISSNSASTAGRESVFTHGKVDLSPAALLLRTAPILHP